MLFNSLQFVVFFWVLFFLYYLVIPAKFRWVLLLVASCYFYMAYVPKFILILLFLVVADCTLGQKIAAASGDKRRKYLWLSIVVNLGTLFFFKYFNFFSENIAALAHLIHWNYSPLLLQIALPLGLSFHVFQSLSYVIEVYKGKQEPEKNYGIYGLYVMFFPQLVAGPIERPQHLLPQFREHHDFNYNTVVAGLKLMVWGMFKKIAVADGLALTVNHVFSNPSDHSGLILIIATVFFTLQIYCDFSGYSDIAVGSALVFGYDLTNNFNYPFSSRSIAEFWRRWHISLSSWLRDYLYYPLAFAGKKISERRLHASLFITFVLIGLWHGANWTYVIFGAIHGFYMVFSLWTKNIRGSFTQKVGLASHPKLHKFVQKITTFALVCFAFIFFRATTLGEAWYILTHLGTNLQNIFHINYYKSALSVTETGVNPYQILNDMLAISFLGYVEHVHRNIPLQYLFSNRPLWYRWCMYIAIIVGILFFWIGTNTGFIYFQF